MISPNSLPEDNQSLFAEDDRLWQQPQIPTASKATIVKKTSPTKRYVVIGCIVMLALLLLASAIVKPRQPVVGSPTTTTEPTPTPQENVASMSAVNRTLLDLDNELKQADPFTTDLPYPPINFDASIKELTGN